MSDIYTNALATIQQAGDVRRVELHIADLDLMIADPTETAAYVDDLLRRLHSAGVIADIVHSYRDELRRKTVLVLLRPDMRGIRPEMVIIDDIDEGQVVTDAQRAKVNEWYSRLLPIRPTDGDDVATE